jgi:spermidine synthase
VSAEPAVATRETPTPLPPSEPAIPPAERRRVLAISIAVFASGAVLLGVEIAASRVLAPFFGNSLFVWGALIGVVLAGLSVGYWAGGALADRLPATQLLLSMMTLGALLVLAIPFVDTPVLETIVAWDPGPRLNPLLAAVVLFGIPSVVFATVTPIAVRLLSRSVTSVGRTAGRLFAISTAGSIVGTFATAFFLIPAFGTNQLLGQAATALLAAVALVALVERLRIAAAVAAVAAVGALFASFSLATVGQDRLTGASARNWSPVYRDVGEADATVDYGQEGFDVVFRRDTQYHRLAVVEDGESRYLRFDNSFQSGMFIDDPFTPRFAFAEHFHLGPAYRPGARTMLVVGLGGGDAVKRLWRDFPGLQLHAVEIDPVVVDVAYRFFELPRDERIGVDVGDGRRFLNRDERQWDVIALDAYFSDSIPFHLTTREFLELVKSRLAPGGVVVANVIGALEGPRSRLFRSFYRTYRSVFPTVLVHPVIEGADGPDALEQLRNVMVVASDSAAPQADFVLERWRENGPSAEGAPDLENALGNRYDVEVETADVPLLTDDYAPTDSLILFDQ